MAMTAWADYAYYISEYLAGRAPTVSETDFHSYAVSATQIFKQYTGRNIADDNLPDEAKCAVCAAVEALNANEAARMGGVASERTGDLSITYESAEAREKGLTRALRTIAHEYLTPWIFLGLYEA